MGWLSAAINKISGAQPVGWKFVQNVKDPGTGVGGLPIKPDECYIELYVDALRLGHTRKFVTTFDGVVYAFAKTARQGAPPAQFAAVTRPKDITGVGEAKLDNVVTFQKRMFKVIPWRGNPLELELGLFAVKTGNLASEIGSYVVRLSDALGLGLAPKLSPLLPLITEGLDLMAGQSANVELELAIDTAISPESSGYYALIRKPDKEITDANVTIGDGGKLLHGGVEIDASYCLFSIRARRDNPQWGEIESLQRAFEDFKREIIGGKSKQAEEALAGFNRQLVVAPDLIDADKVKLKAKAFQMLGEAFPGGPIAGTIKERENKYGGIELTSLNLYDSVQVPTSQH
jgi:hypothetical protein